MFTMEKFFVFEDSFSLLAGLHQLLASGEWLLFLLIFLFSLLLPCGKFALSFKLAFSAQQTAEVKLANIKRLAMMSKWSMADVFVIAVLASTIKVGGLAKVTVHSGLYVFALSVLLSMLLTQRLLSPYELVAKRRSR